MYTVQSTLFGKNPSLIPLRLKPNKYYLISPVIKPGLTLNSNINAVECDFSLLLSILQGNWDWFSEERYPVTRDVAF